MKYVAFNFDTGAISQWGFGIPPEGFSYIEHDLDGDFSAYYVDISTQKVIPKAAMALTVPATTPADGVSEAAIAGIPAGTRAFFRVSGVNYDESVEDGTLELSVYDPQTVTVQFWHPSMAHPPVELVFV